VTDMIGHNNKAWPLEADDDDDTGRKVWLVD